MSLRYAKIQNSPKTFIRLFGLSVKAFDLILSQVAPEWERQVIGRYKRPGRDYKLELVDMVLMLLLYYRSYTTQLFIGFLFGVDDSRVCRHIHVPEPWRAQVMAISKTRHLSQEDVEALILDTTEQQIERPKKHQKVYYTVALFIFQKHVLALFMILRCTSQNPPSQKKRDPMWILAIKGWIV